MKISLNIQLNEFFNRFELNTTSLACFPSNCLSYLAKERIFQKMSKLAIAKFTTSTTIDIPLQISVKQLRASTMCRAFTPDSRYDNNINKLIGNVYCANTVCSGILCVHRKTFKSLSGSDYQCRQSSSTCRVRNIPREEQTNFFSWSMVKGFKNSRRRINQFKMLLETCIVQHAQTKSVFTFQTTKRLVSTTVKSTKPALTCRIFLLKTKNRQLCCLVLMVHITLQEKWFVIKKEQNPSPFLKKFVRQSQSSTLEPVPKKCESHSGYGRISSTPHWLIQLTKNSFPISFNTLSVYSKATSFSQSPKSALSGLSTLD